MIIYWKEIFPSLLYFVLTIASLVACSKQSSRIITQVIIPDSLQRSFELNGTMIKYMTDEGIPVVEHILNARSQIIISVGREYVNVGIQDNEKRTRNFVLRNGDAVELAYNNDGELTFTHKNQDYDALPYDDNYLALRDSILFSSGKHSFDEFLRYWFMLDATWMTDSIDDELWHDLEILQKRSIQDFAAEKALLDSLESKELLSSYVAEFYRLVATFDSIRIVSYPQFSFSTLVSAFEAMAIAEPELFNDPRYLVFYDDCIENHYRKIFTRSTWRVYEISDPDSLYSVIGAVDILDRSTRVQMLLHHVLFVCKNSPQESCRKILSRFENDPEVGNGLAEKMAGRF